jgi:hypothetical protein
MEHDSRNDDVQHVLDSELRLLDPHVRRSVDQVARLLHPDFFEFGVSGRRWDRHETVAALRAEGMPDEASPITVSDLDAVRRADDVVLVTYATQRGERRARRSSLWWRTETVWHVYFHQATPIPG